MRTSAGLTEGLQQGERQPQLQTRELKDFRRFRQAHPPADQHDDYVHHDQHAEDESYVEEYPRRPGRHSHWHDSVGAVYSTCLFTAKRKACSARIMHSLA
jgi:hypothetical protein